MKPGRWPREVDVALRAVRDGAVLAREIRERSGERAAVKPDRSPVTVADFAVQALVADRLARAFPGDPLVAEEDAGLLRLPEGRAILQSVREALGPILHGLDSSRILDAIDRGRGTPAERFWTLDPVDGTKGFVRGDQYVVALALVVQGRVEIGVLGCPRIAAHGPGGVGSLVWAVRSGGAFRVSLAGGEEAPLHVSSCREPGAARVLRSFESEHMDRRTFDDIIAVLNVEPRPTLMDSQAKHAVIAGGGADLLIRVPATREFRDKIWDQAAGSIVVEEAGGCVTDLRGAPLDFAAGRLLARNEGLVASNGHLHAAVLDAVRRISPGFPA
jgi:3'(2'), 5'-bisphosphate nucleotidase